MRSVRQKFLVGGLPESPNTAEVRQTTFVNSFSAIAILVLGVFGLVNIFQERQLFVGAIEIAMALVNVVNLFTLRVRKDPLFASRVLLASVWLLLILLLVTGGIERTGIYWYFVLPPATYFLLGRREGSAWVASLVLVTGILGILAWMEQLVLPYTSIEIRQVIVTVLVVSFLMTIFEQSRARFEKEVISLKELTVLKERFSQIQRALNESIAGILVIDQNSNITFVNKAWLRMCGYENPKSIMGHSFSELIDTEGHEQFEKVIARLRSGKEYIGELSLKKQDGSKLIIWAQIKLSLDGAKGRSGFVVTGRDITEQKRQEQQNKAILDALPDLYFRLDRVGTYLDYHAVRGSDLYVSSEEFLGKKLSDVVPSDVAKKALDKVEVALDTRETQEFDYELVIADTKRFFQARIAPLEANEVVAIVRDVTKSRTAELGNKARTNELERMNEAMIDRELKMKELKAEIIRLRGSSSK